MLQIDDPISAGPDAAGAPEGASTGRRSERRKVIALAMAAYVLLRIESILVSPAFVTPDTSSYTSGQGVRPPLGALLLTQLGPDGYQFVSAVVSTIGFLAVMVVLWNAARPRLSAALIAVLVLVSFMPTFHVYEHWLIPDSLLIGLCGIALALAWPQRAPRWRAPALFLVLVMITLTKEIGFGLALLVLLIVAIRWSWKTAVAGAVLAGLLFVMVVSPASDRPGRVLQQQPLDTQLTMNRFRIIAAGLGWWDLDPRLREVNVESAKCGMTVDQLMQETFGQSSRVVNFRNCPDLWKVTDSMSQLDVLMIHAQHPRYVRVGVERGFAPYMYAMSQWSDYRFGAIPWLKFDHYLAGLLALLPLAVLALALARRRSRRLALVAVAAQFMALCAVLVDPSGQDRHAAPFRVVAVMIALLVLGEIFAERREPVSDAADEPIHSDVLEAAEPD